MDSYLDLFLNHIVVEKGAAPNTVEAYSRDLTQYLEVLGKVTPHEVRPLHIAEYLKRLKERGIAPRSRARALSALRMLHRFLVEQGYCEHNPASTTEGPKGLNRLPAV